MVIFIPPSSRVAPPTSSLSYISNIASPFLHLGLTHSASVLPTSPTCSASVAPTSLMRFAHTVPVQISTPGNSSAPHRSVTPAVPSYCSSTLYHHRLFTNQDSDLKQATARPQDLPAMPALRTARCRCSSLALLSPSLNQRMTH